MLAEFQKTRFFAKPALVEALLDEEACRKQRS
jgi:hypothetical protein